MKYFTHFFTLTLFCIACLPLHAMEEEPMERGLIVPASAPKTITFKTVDGKITFDATRAKKLKTIKHLMNDFSSDFKPEVDLQSFINPPTIQSIELLINFIKNPATTSLNVAQQEQVFNAANMLEAPKPIRYELAKKLLPHAIKLKQRNHEKFDLSTIEHIVSNLPWSIKTAQIMHELGYQPETLLQILPLIKDNYFIYLGDQGLQSLDGIEKLANQRTQYLDISNNKLKKLDLKKIKSTFPGIIRIFAQNNHIKKLYKEDLKAISKNLSLDLDDNRITRCEQTSFLKTPENIHISLKKNPLTSEALNNLSASLEESKYQRLSHNFCRRLIPATSTIDTPIGSLATNLLFITIYVASTSSKSHNILIDILMSGLCAFFIDKAIRDLNNFVTYQATKQCKPNTIDVDHDVSYIALKSKERAAKREEETNRKSSSSTMNVD